MRQLNRIGLHIWKKHKIVTIIMEISKFNQTHFLYPLKSFQWKQAVRVNFGNVVLLLSPSTQSHVKSVIHSLSNIIMHHHNYLSRIYQYQITKVYSMLYRRQE